MFDHFQTDTVSLRFGGRTLSGVALVHVRQLHRFAGCLLRGLRKLAHPLPVLLVGRGHAQGEQVPQSVFEPFFRFAPS